MRRQITQKEKDLVVQLYASRFKIDDIVSLTKLSPSTINRIVNEANLKKRKSTMPLNETLEKILSTLELILQKLNDLEENENGIDEFTESLMKGFDKLNQEKKNKTST